ncbi:hypothetical protein BCR33DRAFT_454881 [Rhizoclosmatium globosum]|uniref:Uncharacterized protein n=1 Tax=Rhizoclosmatium globosum TaxID=329046 RepID=A0A1Y2CX31_9FUNG|nr:hypothetical protein BCR33DRAFT_454881 [Rhizoclosmatium globosum]|eukprot:ORY51446.1 hypothetical protein BCR33DRAFT_454881 [Rhizoclosmatium globosum]
MLRSSAPPAAATLKSVSKSTSDSAVSVKPTVKAVTPTNASSRVPTKPISKQPSFNSLDQSATRKTPISTPSQSNPLLPPNFNQHQQLPNRECQACLLNSQRLLLLYLWYPMLLPSTQ